MEGLSCALTFCGATHYRPEVLMIVQQVKKDFTVEGRRKKRQSSARSSWHCSCTRPEHLPGAKSAFVL